MHIHVIQQLSETGRYSSQSVNITHAAQVLLNAVLITRWLTVQVMYLDDLRFHSLQKPT